MSLTLPDGVVEIYPPDNLILADNVMPSCAIAQNAVYYLHFAGKSGVPGGAVMRVVKYPFGSVHGEEVKLLLNPNAASRFVEYRGVLSVVGNHDEYDSAGRKIKVHVVSVPVPDVVCPCTIF